jgi:hypothetical protein
MTPVNIIWAITAATFALHLTTSGGYGFFRNELYFIICGRHPDFGYADQPPLVPLLAAATQVFGPNLWLLRLPADLAAACLVPLTARYAQLLGAGAAAQIGAAAAVSLAPGLVSLTSTLSTSTFEPLAWTGCAYFLSRALLQDRRRDVILAALIAGLAAEAKYGIAIWGAGLAIGLVMFPSRRILAWRDLWIGLLLAGILAAPSLIWQANQGWPFFEIINAPITSGKGYIGSPLQFSIGLGLAMNWMLAPLWLIALAAPFFVERLRGVRLLAPAVPIAAAIDYMGDGKAYYLYPAFPTLFALGAAALSSLNRFVWGVWLSAAAASFAFVAPAILPMLEPAQLDQYLTRFDLRPRPIEAASVGAPLTQRFSDEMGWDALEHQVASIYQNLPDSERKSAAIMASNYGEAAAIDLYGPADHLPPALSAQNQYFLWGPRQFDGQVIIHIGGSPARWHRLCEDLEAVGEFGAPYAMPYETGRPIFICRGLKIGLAELWPRLKRYR